MSSHGSTRTLLDRIGGPNSLAWPVFAVLYAFTWLIYVLGMPTVTWSDPLGRIAALTFVQIMMFAVLIVAKVTILRDTATRPRPWATLAVFAVVSTGGDLLGFTMEWQGLVAPHSLTSRISSSLPAIFFVLVLTALATDGLTVHRRTRNLLIEQRDRLDHTREVITQEIVERQQQTVDMISEELTGAIDALTEGSAQEAVETLQRAAHEIVRPLSHELATHSYSFTPEAAREQRLGLDWGKVLTDATTGRPIPPVALTVTLVVMGITFRFNRMGGTDALVSFAASAIVLWLGAHAANRLLAVVNQRLSAGARAVTLTIALAMLGVLDGLIERLLTPEHSTTAANIIHITAAVFAGWAVALARTAQQQMVRTEAELDAVSRELAWEIARANQTQWQQQRALARALHGPVQAAVNAAAIRLDGAVRDGTISTALIEHEQRNIIDALGILPSVIAESTPNIDLVFQRIQGTWAGICDITLSMSDQVRDRISRDATCACALSDIVTESCANAIRHGHAAHISVDIAQPDSVRLLCVTIENDGDPIDPSSPTGLGTSVIDDVALDWHREPQGHGTRVSVMMPTTGGEPRRTGASASRAED